MYGGMNKTLQQIQEENRRQIIMACNPEAKSYEEALQLELQREGCLINVTLVRGKRLARVLSFDADFGRNTVDIFFLEERKMYSFLETTYNKPEIIGKPLTLDRLFLTLNEACGIHIIAWSCHGFIKQLVVRASSCQGKRPGDIVLDWDLTKQTLEEQTEEVQRSINKILMGNENN